MSDKSFGDHTNRNIVKNPLLSSAVTGLSLEDLTHKAVLLPVSPSLDQITRSDQQQGSQTRTLAHSHHEISTFPSGDAFPNITLSNMSQTTNKNLLDCKKTVNLTENRNTQSVTQSKAPTKSDDDFDVNEYIARLQGTRYVSAPLHSHLKEDQNANLEETEENLEEINLNESVPAESQQSLTADIAQNFSQLPTVLPHVASAVFSSFSNMLSYKSREHTPDRPKETEQGTRGGYDEVQFQGPDVTPMMGVEEHKVPKEVAPPPKEPPAGGASSFRITTKKKYAQIPGLSSGDTTQKMTYPPMQNMPPFGQNISASQSMQPSGPSVLSVGHNMPPVAQNIPQFSQNTIHVSHNKQLLELDMSTVDQPVPSFIQNVPSFGKNASESGQDTSHSQGSLTQNPSAFAQDVSLASQSVSCITNMPTVGHSGPEFVQIVPLAGNETFLDPNTINEPKVADNLLKNEESNINTQLVAGKQTLYNILTPVSKNLNEGKDLKDIRPNLLTNSQNYFTPVEPKEQNIPSNAGNSAIIPPPPMFSNFPRRDSQSSVGKSVLPPSVARRISANHPIIKPTVSAQNFTENIFVPALKPDITESIQADTNYIHKSSSFATAYNPSSIPEAIKQENYLLPSSQNIPASIQLPVETISPNTYFITPKEAKPSSAEIPVIFTTKDTESTLNTSFSSSSVPVPDIPVSSSDLPIPAFLPSTFSMSESTVSSLPTSSFTPGNIQPASSIFTPSNAATTSKEVPPQTFQSPLRHIPSLTSFSSLQAESSFNTPYPITRMSPVTAPEVPKPVPEPPKPTGNVNFRMTKKRPQYYAGPIEGVGAISNNVKPIIAPVMPSATSTESNSIQSTLFTPDQQLQPVVEQYLTPHIDQASVLFDISNSMEHAPFDISKPHAYDYGTSLHVREPESQNYEHEYNTPFDMSRDPADYSQPKQEPTGFGIIGSLKSKLSSIDINKIQNTVTTFFDPAYNDTKITEPIAQDNLRYQQRGQIPPEQSNFDIFVPKDDNNQYNQCTHGFGYSHNNQYHETSYLQDQGQTQNTSNLSTSRYFLDSSYSTEQVYACDPLYDNTQTSHLSAIYNPQENISEKLEILSVETPKTDKNTYASNSYAPESMSKIQQNPTCDNNTYQTQTQGNCETSQQALNIFDQNIKNQQKSSDDTENISFYNPNTFRQGNGQMKALKSSYQNFENLSQPLDQENVVVSAPENQKMLFYNPNAEEFRQTTKSHQFFESIIRENTGNKEDLTAKIQTTMSEFEILSQQSCDSALNTSKYNIESVQPNSFTPTNVPLVPADSFFNNPKSASIPQCPKKNEIFNKLTFTGEIDNQGTEQKQDIKPKYSEIGIMQANTSAAISTIIQNSSSESGDKDTHLKKEQQVKQSNLIESLSTNNIPVVGVSTVPFLGLSAMIADKPNDGAKSEITPEKSLFDGKSQGNLFENRTSESFFESDASIKKIISETQVNKTSLDITALSIDDVKNVLVIEPPQENIGVVLKKNASSSKLENLPERLPQLIKQHNDDSTIQAHQEKLILNIDENTSKIIFKNSDDVVKESNKNDPQIVANVNEDHSEFNICETCREVSTPERERKHKDPEDLTSQLIENITSRVQLSHPVTIPLKESDTPLVEGPLYDEQQLDEITHVAEKTFETLQIQSATELLDKRTTSEVRDYGWITDETVYPEGPPTDHVYASKIDSDTTAPLNYDLELSAGAASSSSQDYEFKLDPNAIGFFGNNSLFFENVSVPTNASDEIKAEIKHSHEDIVLPRQMSIPTAPPEEDHSKLDEPGVLDVHSIEQDAKKDFPLEEEFIIEPSIDEFLSTDDDKIEFRERKRSSEDSTSNDTFTNRVERFKKNNDNPDDSTSEQKHGSPPISMASYFDTGNYAVESHYRNSLITMRIPPGFEEEYVRRLSGLSLLSENTTEPYIPDTSTQTRPINSPTYSSPSNVKENIIGSEMRKKEHTESLTQAFSESRAVQSTLQCVGELEDIADAPLIHSDFTDTTTQSEYFSQNAQSLSDPMTFFSSNEEEPKVAEPAVEESFSRLASYFSLPPAQPEHSKSFFELSQSQNHYRHEPNNQGNQKSFFELSQSQNHYIDDDTKNSIKKLMKDLTSPQNTKEQTIKIVNYFTVELNKEIRGNKNAVPINIKLDEIDTNKNRNSLKGKLVDNDFQVKNNSVNITKQFKVFDHNSKVINSNIVNEKGCKPTENDIKIDENQCDDIMNCEYCRRYVPEVNTKVFIVKSAVNGRTESSNESGMSTQKDNTTRIGNTANFADFDVEKQAESGVSVTNEHRVTSEYTPVKHHWFYRLDVEEKSVWRGFSNTDSQALEDAHNSPDLNEDTLVATDGGRYDVNVVGRLRVAVYWKEKPTNVRRCSWFYKGTTDARYVPYTEVVAEKLEEEYRHGVTTGAWHRKLALPNSEMVIMHGPSVMVHFLHSGATDAFTTPPQAASRPRVVRRSHEESEIEECEPSRVDHLLLLCHGVGSACDMRFRSVEEVVEDFRATSLQLLQSHYRNSYDNGLVSRVEVLPISWHEQLHSGETGVDRRLARVTLDSIPRLRAFTNNTVLDVLFYTSPVFHQTIIDTVCSELNRVYNMFRCRNPHFTGTVSLGGHSLGSVILYDLLCHQAPEPPLGSPLGARAKRYVTGYSGTGQPVEYPQLVFSPAALYALGSPIAIFECIRGVESLGMEFSLPTCKNFFNIFHPYDPIAYRIEPLINPQLQEVKPSLIPHHKGRKRMHLELKDTMARVGADLKQKLLESLRTTWNKWRTAPPPDGQLEKVVEEEMEKEQLASEEEAANEMQASPESLGRLNGGRRVDYVLQEAPLEMINEYLFAMSSHVGYWESEDTMLLMLREIYGALGVQPDSTVPQQSLTVQRTKTLHQDETTKLISEEDTPSTSRGGTC